MIFNYLRHSLGRNKTRSLLISSGIIISIMLISGVMVASNSMATYMIEEKLDQIKVDFAVSSRNKNYTEVLQVLNGLNDSEQGIKEFQAAFAQSQFNYYQTYLQPGNSTIDWNPILNSHSEWGGMDYSFFNNTYFCGISSNIFQDVTISQRFENVIGFNDTFDFSQQGIYLDSKTAKKYNLKANDSLSLGFFYQSWNYEEEKQTSTNHTAEVQGIPIIGIYTVPDRDAFGYLFGNQWGRTYIGDDDVILLGNLTYLKDDLANYLISEIKTSVENAGDNYYQEQEASVRYGILIDHSVLAKINPNLLESYITKMETRISVIGESVIQSLSNQIGESISSVMRSILIFQGIFLIISLPVLLLGWYLSKTNWVLSYQQRRRELALLKVKGGLSRQLTFMFYMEAIIIGIFGGFLGIIGGNLTSSLVLNQIFPDALAGKLFGMLLTDTLLGRSISWTTWLVGLGGAITISLLSVRKPLKDFSTMKPIDGLQKYHESSQNELPKKKRDVAVLLLGIIPILVALFTQGIINPEPPIYEYGVMPSISSYNPFVSLFLTISTILLPLAPFALIYGTVKLLCRNVKVFGNLISRISRVFNKQISVFTSKSIIRNQARSFRLVFIVAMSLSFMVMASTIESTELEYQDQMHTIDTADGFRMYFWSQEFQSKSPSELFDLLWSESESLDFSGFNYQFNLRNGRIGSKDDDGGGGILEASEKQPSYDVSEPYFGSTQLKMIDAKNFSKFVNLRDDWFADLSASEAMQQLEIPGNALIPQSLIDQGYIIGDNVTISYELANGTMVDSSIIIAGVYNAFPIISSGYNWAQSIILDNSSISDGRVQDEMQFIFYKEDSTNTSFDANLFKEVLEQFDPHGYAGEPWISSSDELVTIENSLIRFLNLESIYLLTIVTFGIAIIMFISISEKSHDMGLLRARGVEKKVLYKIQIAEGSTLIFLGSLFTGIGIVGGAAMILQLNNMFMLNTGTVITRNLIIPWIKILGQLAISMIAFIIAISISVFLETKKSNVSKIGELLRVDA
ncbi:hypothetical protein NEF87_001747 [Candidatus Lokiarchaeum ossiferum]|uniref:ABC3 transporter permease C-terminal domain-containing protein n=1 Tax=Candidatus Lokiarchaeum ossiferum TaxID=2951803 RepID=A0ABY6HRG1_9ARCH|nr:hypothetical protein NEF87_001747 [Candidatus Lokiarchaeum sp. B-35]